MPDVGFSWYTVSMGTNMEVNTHVWRTLTHLTSTRQMLLIIAKETESHTLNSKTKTLILTARAANVINTPVRNVR